MTPVITQRITASLRANSSVLNATYRARTAAQTTRWTRSRLHSSAALITRPRSHIVLGGRPGCLRVGVGVRLPPDGVGEFVLAEVLGTGVGDQVGRAEWGAP